MTRGPESYIIGARDATDALVNSLWHNALRVES
jgi:hypothetical protein